MSKANTDSLEEFLWNDLMNMPGDSYEDIFDVHLMGGELECIHLTELARDRVKAKVESLIKAKQLETEKAYGGCHNCYGKGYATGAELYSAKGKQWGERNKMKFCTCSRGQQLESLINSKQLELLERVDKEVIGENEYGNIGYNGEEMVDDTSEDMLYRNSFRQEQRKSLDTLKKEIKEKDL